MGLLILRVATGTAILARGLSELTAVQPVRPPILEVTAIIAGALLCVGLWTPVSGGLVAAFEFWALITKSGDPWSNILLAATCVALAMIGPGVWSLDARLFGWRRVVLRDR
jgi:uncharacterized membrane protein YphA (DoxX/SURF4 family)